MGVALTAQDIETVARRVVELLRQTEPSEKGRLPATQLDGRRPQRGDRAPTLLVTRQAAARSLGMSLSHFQRHVQPGLPCVYSGQLRLFRMRDLERWADASAAKEGRLAA
jgi:hypothetical protein